MSLFLAATLAALACGPLLYALTRSVPQWRRGFDLLVWISIVGLLLVEIIPHAVEDGGGLGFAWLIAGFALPTVLERSFRRIRETTHWVALSVAVAGLAVHALADGAILANIDANTRDLGASIALHSLPIGLAVCWLLIPPLGWLRSVLVIGGIGAATVVGFVITPDLPQLLGQQGWAWLQMCVAGLLMHALTGRPHLHHGVPKADRLHDTDPAPDSSSTEPVLRGSP